MEQNNIAYSQTYIINELQQLGFNTNDPSFIDILEDKCCSELMEYHTTEECLTQITELNQIQDFIVEYFQQNISPYISGQEVFTFGNCTDLYTISTNSSFVITVSAQKCKFNCNFQLLYPSFEEVECINKIYIKKATVISYFSDAELECYSAIDYMGLFQFDIYVEDCKGKVFEYLGQYVPITADCLGECGVNLISEVCNRETNGSSDTYSYTNYTQQEIDQLIAQYNTETCSVTDQKTTQYDYEITTTTTINKSEGKYNLDELHLYGSSRLGLLNEDQNIVLADFEEECVEVETEITTTYLPVPITGTDLVGMIDEGGGSFYKTTSSNSWGNAGFASVESIAADGYVEWKPIISQGINIDAQKSMVGLSYNNANASYTDIDFAFYIFNSNYIKLREFGNLVMDYGYIQANQTLKIERSGNQIKYWVGNNLVRTTTEPV